MHLCTDLSAPIYVEKHMHLGTDLSAPIYLATSKGFKGLAKSSARTTLLDLRLAETSAHTMLLELPTSEMNAKRNISIRMHWKGFGVLSMRRATEHGLVTSWPVVVSDKHQ